MASDLVFFYFEIEFIKGNSNSLPDFLSHEFLQGQWVLKSPNQILKPQKPLCNAPGQTRKTQHSNPK